MCYRNVSHILLFTCVAQAGGRTLKDQITHTQNLRPLPDMPRAKSRGTQSRKRQRSHDDTPAASNTSSTEAARGPATDVPKKVLIKVRALFTLNRAAELAQVRQPKAYQERRSTAQAQWATLEANQREAWIQQARRATSDDGPSKSKAAKTSSCEDAATGLRWRGAHGLATWNGSWGVFIVDLQGSPSLEDLTGILQQRADVKDLWGEFCAWSAAWDERHGVTESSLQMELSTPSEEIRVHLHKYFSLSKAADWTVTTHLSFKDSRPNLQMNRGRGKQQEKSANRGHYYAAAPKSSRIFSLSTKKPHVDYTVDPSWPTALWSQRKMSHDNYRSEIVQGRQQVVSRLRNLDAVVRAEKDMLEGEERRAALKSLPVYKPRRLPEVQRVMATLKESKYRYPFLVLCGPSGLGKTEYVKSLYGPEATYECDCSSTLTPDLTGFDRNIHKAVLFDEATPQLVLQNKKLFQAHVSPAVLGQTTTGCFSYKVWLWQRLLVVGTNTWDVAGLNPAEQAWLKANSIVVWVRDRLYTDPEP